MKISEHIEFENKPKPLTAKPDITVADAAARMRAKNFGSIVVVNDEERLVGLVTERDIMNRVVAADRDPQETPVRDVMTTELRVAHEDDNVLDWLRVMSNERFRRLPVVDDQRRVSAVMTQGDFVAYTWPELLGQAKELTKASLSTNSQLTIMGAGLLVYTAMVLGLVTAL